jgi:hypothetical protein
VSPAALVAFPQVYTLLGINPFTNFRNYDFAVEGSPTTQTFRSPLSFMPS